MELSFFVIVLASIFASFQMYHVRKPLASHSSMLAYDHPAYMLRNPTRKLIRVVKRKFSSLKFSGAVLLKYPARLVMRAIMMATGAALAAAQIPCAHSSGTSGGASSVAMTGKANASTRRAKVTAKNVFFVVSFHLRF